MMSMGPSSFMGGHGREHRLVLSHAAATSITLTTVSTADSKPVHVEWPDDSTSLYTSGATNAAKTYGSSTSGEVVLRSHSPFTRVDVTGAWNFNLSSLSGARQLQRLTTAGSGSVSGDLSALAALGSFVYFSSLQTGGTITGDATALMQRSGLVNLTCSSPNTLSGTIMTSIPATCIQFIVQGSNTLTGVMPTSLPSTIGNFTVQGNNTISGSFPSLPATGARTFVLIGNNTLAGTAPASLPSNALAVSVQGSATTSGGFPASLPAGMTTYIMAGSTAIAGALPALPASMLQFQVGTTGSNVSGTLPASFPTGLQRFGVNGTVGGTIPTLPSTLTEFIVTGSSTISGSMPASIPTGLQRFTVQGGTLGGSWAVPALPAVVSFLRNGGTVGFDQAAVDGILAALVTAGLSNGICDLTSPNASPSASGLASKATLQSRGWSVLTA